MKIKKKNVKIIVLCTSLSFLILLGLYSYNRFNERKNMWQPTFINTKTGPYDTYICYNLLQELNGKRNVVSTRRPIYTNLKDSLENYFYYNNQDDDYFDDESSTTEHIQYSRNSYDEDDYDYDEDDSITKPEMTKVSDDSESLSIYNDININDTIAYVFINTNFTLEAADKEYFLDFIGIGNNTFISAENIDSELLNFLDISTDYGNFSNDTIYTMSDNPEQRFNFTPVYSSRSFNIEKSKYPVRVLAKNREGRPVFIQVRYGKGNIFLHTIPNAFTNQNLVRSSKYKFAFQCLSYIPKTNKMLWDEYQTQGPVSNIFAKMSKQTPLLISFLIVILGFGIFVIFRAKRVQRVIPIIKPPVNSSIEFLDTISNLYYKKKDFTVIVNKRHAYFLDFIRKNYYLSTESVNDEFVKNVSVKSGFSQESLSNLFRIYNDVKMYGCSHTTFLNYNHTLDQFYKVAKNK